MDLVYIHREVNLARLENLIGRSFEREWTKSHPFLRDGKWKPALLPEEIARAATSEPGLRDMLSRELWEAVLPDFYLKRLVAESRAKQISELRYLFPHEAKPVLLAFEKATNEALPECLHWWMDEESSDSELTITGNDHKPKPITPKSKRIQAIRNTIGDIFELAKKKGFHLDINSFPGTKADFFELVKGRHNNLDWNISMSTFQGYLDEIDPSPKFLSGTRNGRDTTLASLFDETQDCTPTDSPEAGGN